MPADVAVGHTLGGGRGEEEPAGPADAELEDGLGLVDPGLGVGLEERQAREKDSPRVYLELTVMTAGSEHDVSVRLEWLSLTPRIIE